MYLSELVIIILFQPGILISVYNIRITYKVLFKKEGGADLHSKKFQQKVGVARS